MMTSFCALVYCGMQFNERETNAFVKWLISFPMFLTSVAARGFTLAVFLKETTIAADMQTSNTTDSPGNTSADDNTVSYEWVGGLCVIAAYCALNVIAFRLSGQDYIRYVYKQLNYYYHHFKFTQTGLGERLTILRRIG